MTMLMLTMMMMMMFTTADGNNYGDDDDDAEKVAAVVPIRTRTRFRALKTCETAPEVPELSICLNLCRTLTQPPKP